MAKPPSWYVRGSHCPECGSLHPGCAKHNATGVPCRGGVGEGKWLCNSHGGRALDEIGSLSPAAVDDLVESYGKIGPLLQQAKVSTRGKTHSESIRDGLDRANAMVAMLEVLVGTLAPAADSHVEILGAGTPRESEVHRVDIEGMVGPDHAGDLQTHPWVILLKEWTAAQVQFAAKASDLGLIERQVRVQEAQVSVVAEALIGVLNDLGLNLEDPAVQAAIERHLLAIDSTVVEIDSPMTAAATSS